MPIDRAEVDSPLSHAWWFKKLARRQADRLPELNKLWSRYMGDSPMPTGPEQGKPAYQAFQKLARTSYEDTIVRAVLDRQSCTGFRTAADDDAGGDKEAARIWAGNMMPVQAATILEHKLAMRCGYAMVSPPDEESDGVSVITAEDPRQTITAPDPVRPWRQRASLKIYFDEDLGLEVAYVAVRGPVKRPDGTTANGAVVRRAQRKAKQSSLGSGFVFSPTAWDWAPDDTWPGEALELRTPRPPVVPFPNRNGLAEFEKHLDLIDRIRHTILQRMVIITMQAFRQRAVKGLPDRYPNDYPVEELRGKLINYDDIFTADPAAVWLLPPGLTGQAVELWESGTLELTPVLEAVKADIREMSSVSRTPFSELMPDGANQSAEGATVQREGIVFKTEDHNTRDGIAFAQVMSLAFEQMDQPERAKVAQIETLWAPVERYSLAQMADAAQKAKGIRPRRAILEKIYQLPPAEAQRELDMLADDAIVDFAVPGQQPDPLQVDSARADQDSGRPALPPGTGSTGDGAAA